MKIENIVCSRSFLHHLDPRAKLIAIISLSLAITLEQGIIVELISLGLGIILIYWAKISWKEILYRTKSLNIFIIIMWVTLPWYFIDPTNYLKLEINYVELTLARNITIKSYAIMFLFLSLISTIPIIHLFYTLSYCHIPKKLLFLFNFFYCYLNIIHYEYYLVQLAMKARNFTPHTNLRTYRTYAWLLGIILMRSYNRAQQIYQAMLCRGFSGIYYSLYNLNWRYYDNIFLISISLIILILFLLLDK